MSSSKVPQEDTKSELLTPSKIGYSKLPSANNFCASGLAKNSTNLIAFFRYWIKISYLFLMRPFLITFYLDLKYYGFDFFQRYSLKVKFLASHFWDDR